MTHYYADKLAFVANAEKTGILTGVLINSFRADCPFCGHRTSLIILLHSATTASSFTCTACGEAGLTGDIPEFIAEKNPVKKNYRRGRSHTKDRTPAIPGRVEA